MIPLNHNLSPLKRSPIRLFTNLARETEDCVLLTIGEPDFDTPQAVCAAAKSALDSARTHYAPNQGTAELRQAVAEVNPSAESAGSVAEGVEKALALAGKEDAGSIFGSLSFLGEAEQAVRKGGDHRG